MRLLMSSVDLVAAELLVAMAGPRERAIEGGIGSIPDADLMAILLGTGVSGRRVTMLAIDLLDRFGGIEGIAQLGPAVLAEQPGVGWVKALRISAALELGRRFGHRALRPRTPMRTSAAVASWSSARLGMLQHEEMWALSLDGRSALRGARRVAQGGLHHCTVSPRDVLRAAIADAASALVLVHNHPSGDPTPSGEDVAMTREVASASAVMGIPLVDHVIVTGDGRHSSMLDLGVLELPFPRPHPDAAASYGHENGHGEGSGNGEEGE
jgi:DNA repair protein RadC